MHINTFDHYQSLESPIHRLDPRVKIAVTVVFILSNVLLPDGAWLAFACSFAFLMLLTWRAKLGFRFVFTRSLVALPFALAAVTAIFSVPGEPVLAIKIGPWMLIATDAGVIRFVSIILRSWLSVQMAIVLTATTPFPDLIHALRHLRIPGVLVSTIAFMYRYLFVLSDETVRLLRARDARSAQLEGKQSGGSAIWQAQVAGNMAGQLFLRSYERSERIYNAMLARGYRGTLLTLNPHEMSSRDWFWGAGMIAMILVVQIIGRLGTENLAGW
jgi:cobalt/nickel transport system permease protein